MKYSLVGIDGVHDIVEYTANALKETGHDEIVDNMRSRALCAADYVTLIYVCSRYLDIANGDVK